MDKKLKVTKESDTGMNMQFQDTRNGHIMSKTELINLGLPINALIEFKFRRRNYEKL